MSVVSGSKIPSGKQTEEQPKRDAFLCVPGLGWDPETSAVELLAKRFVAAFERNAPPKDRYTVSEGRQQEFRDGKRSSRVITVNRKKDDGTDEPILDLYELNYHKELVDRFAARHFLSQATSVALQLIWLIPVLLRSYRSPAKSFTARTRLVFAWLLILLLMLYLGVIVVTGVLTLSQGLPTGDSTAAVSPQDSPEDGLNGGEPLEKTEDTEPGDSANSAPPAPEEPGSESQNPSGSAGGDAGKGQGKSDVEGGGTGQDDDGGTAADIGLNVHGRSTAMTLRQSASFPVAAGSASFSFTGWIKQLLPWTHRTILPWMQWLVVVLTATGLFFKKSLRDLVTTFGSKATTAIDYLRLGTSKRDVLGQFTSLLDFVGEQGYHNRIHVLSYSFGTIVALDSVFPENKPSRQLASINTLITIGSPLDIVRAYWPNYFVERYRPSESMTWMNVYTPIDILSSNCLDEPTPKVKETATEVDKTATEGDETATEGEKTATEATEGEKTATGEKKAKEGKHAGIVLKADKPGQPVHPDPNVEFHTGAQPGLSVLDIVANSRFHRCYWGKSDDTDSCLDGIIKELYPKELLPNPEELSSPGKS